MNLFTISNSFPRSSIAFTTIACLEQIAHHVAALSTSVRALAWNGKADHIEMCVVFFACASRAASYTTFDNFLFSSFAVGQAKV